MSVVMFAKRNTKEILRDPLNFFFGLGFPLILLALLTIINNNIPAEAENHMFAIDNLAPGMAVFGTVFMALFAGMLIAKDRFSSFLMRLFTSPMTAADYILGYALPLVVMSAAQAVITFAAACLFGLPLSARILLGVAVTVFNSFLFIGMGLLLGSLLNEKAVGGVCGALLTNLAGWLSGIFLPLELIGGAFETVAHILPFYHCVQATRAAVVGDYGDILPHLAVVAAYALVIFAAAVFAFRHKMRGGKT